MTANERTEIAQPMHHVLVDFENVSEVDLSVIGNKSVNFTFLLGAKQTKLDVGLVEKLLRHAASVQLVRLESSGRNALDFALAYYLGRAVLADPSGFFHIVSKDAGYDPLIAHLKGRHVKARRHESFATLNFSQTPKSRPADIDTMLAAAIEHLKKNVSNRPARRTTLARHLKAAFGNNSNDAEISALVDRLVNTGHLSINDGGRVSYTL